MSAYIYIYRKLTFRYNPHLRDLKVDGVYLFRNRINVAAIYVFKIAESKFVLDLEKNVYLILKIVYLTPLIKKNSPRPFQ